MFGYVGVDDVIGVRAKDTAGEAQAVFEIRAFDAAGESAETPQDVQTLEISAVPPARGVRRISLHGEPVVDTFTPNTQSSRLVAAIERELSNFNAASDQSAGRVSVDPSFNFQVSGSGCYTKTTCVVVVLECDDRCCAGWRYNDKGLPEGTDCKTIKKYACGACFGVGNGSVIDKIKGWFK